MAILKQHTNDDCIASLWHSKPIFAYVHSLIENIVWPLGHLPQKNQYFMMIDHDFSKTQQKIQINKCSKVLHLMGDVVQTTEMVNILTCRWTDFSFGLSMSCLARVPGLVLFVSIIVFLELLHHWVNKSLENPHSISGILAKTTYIMKRNNIFTEVNVFCTKAYMITVGLLCGSTLVVKQE